MKELTTARVWQGVGVGVPRSLTDHLECNLATKPKLINYQHASESNIHSCSFDIMDEKILCFSIPSTQTLFLYILTKD